ncbi:MAG: acyl-CoA dehydrogenase family protein [Halobacteria archaeon]|nr:acyl-CoA dehydrogenase family protein [Halobacteria archaeon]
MDGPFDYGDLDEGRGVNYWEYDPTLRREARRIYGEEFEDASAKLSRFGEVIGNQVADNSDVIDDKGPELRTYDKNGDVVNQVDYHPKQFENERLVFESGAVADSFVAPEGRDEPLPLYHSLVNFYLLGYVDTGLACSVSMTGGAALVLENHGEGLDEFYKGLTARDHDEVVQGAMFLTERQGGTDVGKNETTAYETDRDGVYEIHGEKWFCSNIDAGAPLVLARRPDAPEGTEGLSLFLVPPRIDGEVNDVYFRRLKDKLGTTSVPTGEVEFRGAEGYLVGETENGFKYMTEMLNYERVTNAVGSAGMMGRALLEAKAHTADREVFGKTLDRHPLMRRDLVEIAVDHEAATAFSFEAARYLHMYERGGENEDDDVRALMRVLVPVAKYRTGRMAVVTNRLLRDAQVAPIWEGASNVLALDLLRALEREGAHRPLLRRIDRYLDEAEHPELEKLAEEVREERHGLEDAMGEMTKSRSFAQYHAKDLADYIFDVYTAALLVAEAQEQLGSDNSRTAVVARRFYETYLGDSRRRGIEGETGDVFDVVVRFEGGTDDFS